MKAIALTVLVVMLAACGGEKKIIEPMSDLPDPPNEVTQTDAGVDTKMPPTGECQSDGDCLGKVSLTPCRLPKCSANSCELEIAPEGFPCDDGDICLVSKTCSAGACEGGQFIACDDANPCTQDACHPATGCQHNPTSGACDDGNPCTLADHCVDGGCVAGNSVCPCENESQCAEWDDQNPCNGTIHCLGGVCKIDPQTVPVCPVLEAGPCQIHGCNPLTGQCDVLGVADGSPCSDGNVCTTGDSCASGVCQAGEAGCACQSNDDCLVFDDGDLCNGLPQCQGGQCTTQGSAPTVCPNNVDPCSPGGCDPKTGLCGNASLPDGTSCDDGNACTQGDNCTGGSCVAQPMSCDDNNPCTNDACVAGSCTFTPNNAPCDDGNPCTNNDTCQAGGCAAGEDECTCLKDADCLPFEDSCEGKLHCNGGMCAVIPGTQVICPNAGNTDCAAEVCVDGTCIMMPINQGAPCFSGPCNSTAICQNGTCVPQGPSTCACQTTQFLACDSQQKWSNDAVGSTDNVDAWACATGDFSGHEYAWTFVTQVPRSVTVKLTNEQAKTSLFLLKDTGGGCAADGCIKAATNKLIFLAQPQTSYYIVVDGKNGDAGTFDIAVDCVDSVETDCTDLVDNDGDLLVDCADDDCESNINCGSESCTNGIDDDDDGLVDCGDDDCASLPVCASACKSGANAYCGLSTFWKTDGYGSENIIESYSCAFQSFTGPEFVYSYKPKNSVFATVSLDQSFFGHSIFVMQDQGGGCNATNCIANGSGSVSFYAAGGVAYYIAIDGANQASGAYKIKMTCDE